MISEAGSDVVQVSLECRDQHQEFLVDVLEGCLQGLLQQAGLLPAGVRTPPLWICLAWTLYIWLTCILPLQMCSVCKLHLQVLLCGCGPMLLNVLVPAALPKFLQTKIIG